MVQVRWEGNDSRYDGKINLVERKYIIAGEIQVGKEVSVQYKKGRKLWKGKITDTYTCNSDFWSESAISSSDEESDSDDDLPLKEVKERTKCANLEPQAALMNLCCLIFV